MRIKSTNTNEGQLKVPIFLEEMCLTLGLNVYNCTASKVHNVTVYYGKIDKLGHANKSRFRSESPPTLILDGPITIFSTTLQSSWSRSVLQACAKCAYCGGCEKNLSLFTTLASASKSRQCKTKSDIPKKIGSAGS